MVTENKEISKDAEPISEIPVLSDRLVVLITGASSGIGEALAIEYAKMGADLILLSRRTERLEALSEKISKAPQRVIFYACDVTHDDEMQKVVSDARSVMGKIDIVIANAGFGVRGSLESLSLSDYQRQFETNVFGVMRTIYATLPDLKKCRGRLVVMGSVLGHVALPQSSAYVMSKFALRGLCETIRPELASHGVSVTLVSPGLVESEFRSVNSDGVFDPSREESAPPFLLMPKKQAAREMIQAIDARQRDAIITFHAKVLVFLNRLFPGLLPSVLAWLKKLKKI